MKESKILTLIITFLKIGAFTFGGGYAMIPLVQAEIVDKHHWITEQEFVDLIAIAQATPGVIAVNTATFVGYKVAGVIGGCLATLGVVLPSFVIICIISVIYEQFRSNLWVSYAFMGIRAGVIVLIFGAVVRLAKSERRTAFKITVMLAAFVLTSFTGINVILVLIAAAILGMIWQVGLGKDKIGE